MSNFYTILTNIGAALHANAQVQQTTVPWTHMALGDGNGNPVVPQQTQAGLVREVHRLPITSLEQHPDNPNWIVVEAVVPSDVGGWTVRETALYGGAGGGSCIAVGNYPATYKPVLAEGAAREMVMRMVIEVSSVATVKLVIDPAVAIASRKWVESLVATPAKAGLVKLATVDEAKEGLRDDVAVTPEGLGAALEAADLSLQLQSLNGRVAALEMPRAITLYPGGTEGAPPTIGVGATVDVPNPFPGKSVRVEPQIFYAGEWGDPGWVDGPAAPHSSYGVLCAQSNSTGKLVVRTGSHAVATAFGLAGSLLSATNNVASAPYRLRVYRID